MARVKLFHEVVIVTHFLACAAGEKLGMGPHPRREGGLGQGA